MKTCITGGAGFIGSHVADAYLAEGAQVVIVDDLSSGNRANVPAGARLVELDIRDRDGVAALFANERFDVVNHHAAQISVTESVRAPECDAAVNVDGLLNVLAACVRSGVDKFVFASSGGTVYGAPDRLPCTEDDPFDPVTPYGITKTAGELYVRFYGREHGLRWTVLRYANVYGPRQDPHGEAGVVAIFCHRMLAGQPVQVYGMRAPGDGGCERDYVYVGDVARANTAALSRGDGDAFNIGTGTRTRTRALAEALAAAAGRALAIEDAPPRAGDLAANCVDPARARARLGWTPSTDLRTGLAATHAFFRKALA